MPEDQDRTDREFAQRLLEMAKNDFAKVDGDTRRPTREAVALWMCDEMLKEASSLDISKTLAKDLRKTAHGIRESILAERPRRPIPRPEA